jgi:hypothetical protein
MPSYTFQSFGTPEYSLERPDHSIIPPPGAFATDTNIILNHLLEFIQALHVKPLNFTAASVNDFPAKIRIEAKKILFPPVLPGPLSLNNPIVDVVVNRSRPSGEPDIWRESVGYAIHPLSNIYVPAGPNLVTVALVPSPGPATPQYWVSANAVAYKAV